MIRSCPVIKLTCFIAFRVCNSFIGCMLAFGVIHVDSGVFGPWDVVFYMLAKGGWRDSKAQVLTSQQKIDAGLKVLPWWHSRRCHTNSCVKTTWGCSHVVTWSRQGSSMPRAPDRVFQKPHTRRWRLNDLTRSLNKLKCIKALKPTSFVSLTHLQILRWIMKTIGSPGSPCRTNPPIKINYDIFTTCECKPICSL